MKPSLENVEPGPKSSFKTGIYKDSYFKRAFHYHPEYELLLINKGYGKRFIGDHVEDFGENDLVLIGSHLPHAWLSDPVFENESSNDSCESIFLQFNKDVFGSQFIRLPELKGVRHILELSARGIKITGGHKEFIAEKIRQFPKLAELDKLLSLIHLLNLIHEGPIQLLASESFTQKRILFASKRINRIHDHIMENYKKNITLQDMALFAGMTPAAFCRAFKKETGSTLSNYVNKIRLDFASRLLKNTDHSISEIAFECGFNSLPYFNKRFKELYRKSPTNYRQDKD